MHPFPLVLSLLTVTLSIAAIFYALDQENPEQHWKKVEYGVVGFIAGCLGIILSILW